MEKFQTPERRTQEHQWILKKEQEGENPEESTEEKRDTEREREREKCMDFDFEDDLKI